MDIFLYIKLAIDNYFKKVYIYTIFWQRSYFMAKAHTRKVKVGSSGVVTKTVTVKKTSVLKTGKPGPKKK